LKPSSIERLPIAAVNEDYQRKPPRLAAREVQVKPVLRVEISWQIRHVEANVELTELVVIVSPRRPQVDADEEKNADCGDDGSSPRDGETLPER
jgi:hypothetical protein